jgi:hypothetical protein
MSSPAPLLESAQLQTEMSLHLILSRVYGLAAQLLRFAVVRMHPPIARESLV